MNLELSLRARRRRLWIGVLAVAVFGLRALIPTGYMLAAVDGQVRLVVCQASVQHSGDAMAMEHGMTMDHDAMDRAGVMHHAGHAASGAEHCPYALAGGASLVAAHHDPVEPYFSLLQPARPLVFESLQSAPPPRHQAPRGPPSLA